jgi:hypothetical protein
VEDQSNPTPVADINQIRVMRIFRNGAVNAMLTYSDGWWLIQSFPSLEATQEWGEKQGLEVIVDVQRDE